MRRNIDGSGIMQLEVPRQRSFGSYTGTPIVCTRGGFSGSSLGNAALEPGLSDDFREGVRISQQTSEALSFRQGQQTLGREHHPHNGFGLLWTRSIYKTGMMSLKKEMPIDQQLHLAALQGNLDHLRSVLATGEVHVDCKDKEGTTPLILAAANNHFDCVLELLNQGADPSARRLTGTCALFFAAQGGFIDTVRLLLEHSAIVDLPSFDGGTPLFVACQCNHQDVVEELLSHGADIHSQMVDGATPLFITAQNGHCKLLKYLISQGADVNLRRKDEASALWIASQMGHADVAKELLEAGAQVDAVREDGATSLFKACHKGHADVVEVLIKYKPYLGVLKNGETPLHAAALFGHLKVASLLLAAGMDPQILNKEGQTAAELASEAGFDYITRFIEKFLLTNDASLPATNGLIDD